MAVLGGRRARRSSTPSWLSNVILRRCAETPSRIVKSNCFRSLQPRQPTSYVFGPRVMRVRAWRKKAGIPGRRRLPIADGFAGDG